MNETILTLITFIIALSIGIFVGKLLFSANFKSEKASLEEKINGLISQIEQSKNQTQLIVQEREALRKEKEVLIIQLSKKETDFENQQRATFCARPGLQRPAAQTAHPRLLLAGDYTWADYPATLEGAVRSGLQAARLATIIG